MTRLIGPCVIAIVAVAAPLFAAPGDMSVAIFLSKVESLQSKGPIALFSSDYALLQTEGRAASTAYKERLKQERQLGHPSSCPPQNHKVDSSKLLTFLRAYPPEARLQTSIRRAIAEFTIRTYPCGG